MNCNTYLKLLFLNGFFLTRLHIILINWNDIEITEKSGCKTKCIWCYKILVTYIIVSIVH